jgi:preprotein translocase subunit SecE
MQTYLINGSVFMTVFVAVIVALVIFVMLKYRTSLLGFVEEVKTELVKCSWPWNPEQTGFRKYKMLIDSTVIVIITSLVLAAYVSGFDFLITRIVGWLVNF